MPTPKPSRRRVTEKQAEEAVKTLLLWSGDDPSREGLRDTPGRVARAYRDWFSGYQVDPSAYLKHVRGGGRLRRNGGFARHSL